MKLQARATPPPSLPPHRTRMHSRSPHIVPQYDLMSPNIAPQFNSIALNTVPLQLPGPPRPRLHRHAPFRSRRQVGCPPSPPPPPPPPLPSSSFKPLFPLLPLAPFPFITARSSPQAFCRSIQGESEPVALVQLHNGYAIVKRGAPLAQQAYAVYNPDSPAASVAKHFCSSCTFVDPIAFPIIIHKCTRLFSRHTSHTSLRSLVRGPQGRPAQNLRLVAVGN